MIACTTCGAEGLASQKFCGECGESLAITCLRGHPNPPSNKFCSECGTSLFESPEPTHHAEFSERRFVSVLFADLVGFTSFADTHDHEDVRSLVTAYFERARAVISSFGGQVDKYIGDAVTAFWGTIEAREDDAERAVRAGLELADSITALAIEAEIPELAVRVGVLSGETSVGPGGNEVGLVLGDIVNTASRLQSASPPGGVLVGGSTRRLTEQSIVYAPYGHLDLKGKAEPVEAWQAIAIADEVGGDGPAARVEPPFVGRTEELRLLKDSLRTVARDQTPRLVSIVGEPGIGKSRLAWELRKFADGLVDTFLWHQGRSPAYGDGVTYWALSEMVRSRARITETDDPVRARTRLRRALAEFIGDDEERDWLEPRLSGLLGLSDVPRSIAGEMNGAVRIFFQRIAERSPVVLVFEDVHWADDALLDFITDLPRQAAGHPIMIVTLARPDLLERRPGWGSAHTGSIALRLGPLGDAEMRSLVGGLVPSLTDEAMEAIIERSGGVPLYAVEFARMLLESSDPDPGRLPIPDSLQAMISARLDRLDPGERALLQDAAILGQSFTVEGLRAVSERDDLDGQLHRLVDHEMLRIETHPLSPERGQYQFVQSVIREVVYARIARRERLERHLAVASHFTSVAPIEAAAVIAHHYMQAYAVDPDDDLARRARLALCNAGRRAIELGAPAQGLRLARQAVDIPGDDDLIDTLELAARAALAILSGDEAVEYGRAAMAWADANGNDEQQARAATILGVALTDSGDPRSAVDIMAPRFDVTRVELGAALARAQMRAQLWPEAAATARSCLVTAEESNEVEWVVDLLNTRGVALNVLGRIAEGSALLWESLRLAEEHSLSYQEWRAINNLSIELARDGEVAVAPLASRSLTLARRSMDLNMVTRACSSGSDVHLMRGDFATVRALLQEPTLDPTNPGAQAYEVDLHMIDFVETGDATALERATRMNVSLQDAPLEPSFHLIGLDRRVDLAWLAGDLSAVWHAIGAIEAADGHPMNIFSMWDRAVLATLEAGDLARLDEAERLIGSRRGKRFDVLRSAIAGGRQILAGDGLQGAVRIAEAADEVERVRGPLRANEFRAVLAGLAPDQEIASDAGRHARGWFEAMGARGLLDRFDNTWDVLDAQNRAAG